MSDSFDHIGSVETDLAPRHYRPKADRIDVGSWDTNAGHGVEVSLRTPDGGITSVLSDDAVGVLVALLLKASGREGWSVVAPDRLVESL